MPAGARERSTRKGMLVFARAYLGWLTVFALMLFAHDWSLKLLAGAAVGLFAGISFVIGHDACHGSLTPHRQLNGWLARFAFGPTLHPVVAWDYSHNVLHHGWTNLRGRDPAYGPFTKAEYDALPAWRRLMERAYRNMLGVGLFYCIEIWCKAEMFPSKAYRDHLARRGSFSFDRTFVVAFFCLQSTAVMLLSRVPLPAVPSSSGTLLLLVLTSILWPYAVSFCLLGFFTFQQHTHPTVAWYTDPVRWSFFRGQIQGTVHIEFPRVVEYLINNVMQHTAHHVDPKIPIYNLHASQLALEAAFGGDILVEQWTLRGYRRLFQVCQLYDFDARRWVGYDGRYTSAETVRVA
jgi:omega-6 fatty acid desaturase (delta-12 desaturase)